MSVYYARRPEEARAAHVLILPGSKNTIPDLNWIRESGWETAVNAHFARGKPIAGICGGFQMMGREIRDPYRAESDIEVIAGLNLLNVTTVLERNKVTRQATARLIDPTPIRDSRGPLFSGYEIHLGETLLGDGTRSLFRLRRSGDDETRDDGAISEDGIVFGTYLHGLFDSRDGLAVLLAHWRRLCGKGGTDLSEAIDPLVERERRYDALADHFRRHMNMDVIYRELDCRR